MVTSNAEIEIKVPRKKAFDYSTDPDRIPDWQASVIRAAGVPGLPEGTEVTIETQVLGRRSVITAVMLENDGLGRTRARSIRGPVEFETIYDYTELSESACRVHVSVSIKAGVVYKLAEPALQSVTSGIIESNLRMLKAILEQA